MRHMRISRLFLLLALAAAAACTKPVPGVCCVGEADCARLGVDEPRPCAVGQACRDFACVAAECATAADCTSPDAPACVDHLCVTRCGIDDDCAGAADGPRCAEDGACVGCLADADCPASAPLCDAEDRRCRGCELDAECASGVCIEADAVCAEPGQIIYVKDSGTDTGGCTSAAPCQTISYALQQVMLTRNVIRVADGIFATPISPITIDRTVMIDGAGATTIVKPANMPLLRVEASAGVVTFEGFTVLGSTNPSDPTITVSSGSLLRVVRSVLDTARIDVLNGGLQLGDLRVTTSLQTLKAVSCSNGSVNIRAVDFQRTTIDTMNCQLNVSRSRFDEVVGGSILAQGGIAIIENNLLVDSYELADLMSVGNLAPGSAIRFNTFVNTSGVSSDGAALSCDGTPAVTSNIFAYGSAHPMGQAGGTPCPARFSLFDSVAIAQHTAGEGNRTGDPATFFADRTSRDFHLSPASPAREAAEGGLPVMEDLERHRRPTPAGSRADAGCFEAP